jgi:hypothetical protein
MRPAWHTPIQSCACRALFILRGRRPFRAVRAVLFSFCVADAHSELCVPCLFRCAWQTPIQSCACRALFFPFRLGCLCVVLKLNVVSGCRPCDLAYSLMSTLFDNRHHDLC